MAKANPGTTNLISWWKLDETSGNALDAHGSNDLTETSGTIASVVGKVGNARDFEAGDTEWFEIADNASLSMGVGQDFTIGLWFKPESFHGSDATQVIAKYDYGNQNREFSLRNLASDPGDLQFECSPDGNTNRDSVATGETITFGNWHFIVCWYSDTDQKIYIQVNNAAADNAACDGGAYNGTSKFAIGADYNNGVATNNILDGIVDEAFVYKRVLTADEREWLYNSGNGRRYEALRLDINDINTISLNKVKTINTIDIANIKTLQGI